MARYLARLSNEKGHEPGETERVAETIREILGSKQSIGHLRIGSKAIEFDLFADDASDLEAKRIVLEKQVARVLTLKRLDLPPIPREKLEVLREGLDLFNEERFWECHEVLEQVWHPARGIERNIIQGLILTAAALVHHQKGESDVCLSMLGKALVRLGSVDQYHGIDLNHVRREVRQMVESRVPRPFTINIQP